MSVAVFVGHLKPVRDRLGPNSNSGEHTRSSVDARKASDSGLAVENFVQNLNIHDSILLFAIGLFDFSDISSN
jgi:hypothetical protein